MPDAFVIAFREAAQCSALLGLLLMFPPVRENRFYFRTLLLSVFFAAVAGFALGYTTHITKDLVALETWTFWRYVAEATIFYAGMVIFIAKPEPISPPPAAAGLFLLGLTIFFFEARAVGFLIQDMGAMKEQSARALVYGVAGLIAGFSPLALLGRYLRNIPFDKTFTLASLLTTIGALQFGMGGVGELEKENILAPLQRNLIDLVSSGIASFQSLLLISDHSFIGVPLADLARYIASDRTALALTLAFIMIPPLIMLAGIFSRPDPAVHTLPAGAQKRSTVAFFRKEIISQTAPVMTTFVVLVVLLHAVNISLNPLYEPPPLPVRETENTDSLRIPLSDKAGSFEDRKIRKFVYYYGTKQIIFIAMLKPDGSIGVALDECAICRPADWNTDAKGYAQKGEHLICKYCMTPIAAATLNSPGGCNPVPVPFKMEDSTITIKSEDLIGTFKKLQELEKKGTHL